MAIPLLAACAARPAPAGAAQRGATQEESAIGVRASADHPDTLAIAATARLLSSDSLRGRGPYTRENTAVARYLAARLERLGARPAFGSHILVPFLAPETQSDTVYNVVAVLPGRNGVGAEFVGITSHLDHLGVGKPDASGDSIYNGFLDAAVPMAMVLDVARRFAASPGEQSLVVMFFNLEERGLVGSRALLARTDAADFLKRLRLVVGVDAGSPAGEALEWQLMGALPSHFGAALADSLARARGWSTSASAPRPISDVFAFSEKGIPILFPIPGRVWRGYSDAQRSDAMNRFDHYHQPSDEWHPEFPWIGTAAYADWLWTIVRVAANH